MGLDGDIQLRRPFIPWPPWSVFRQRCGSNRGVSLLRLLRGIFGGPKCYISVLATIVFAPVGISIEDTSVSVIAMDPTCIST